MKITSLLVAPLLAALLLSTSGLSIAASTAADSPPTKGEVLEVREVDMYTYLRLKTAQGETWAAVEKTPVKVGAQVSISDPTVMHNFESKALKKTFDQIVFGSLANPGKTVSSNGASPHGSMGAPAAAGAVPKLAKASGADAHSVAEVVDGKTALKDKSVTLHAQVVKANLGIMGKNWYHVQDGSGTAAAGANDILVTSQDLATVGEVLTIKGTVRTQVSLGSGYDYAVMVENASLHK